MYARYVVPLSLDAAAAASSCRGELAPCIAGPEPVLRALSHFDGLVMRKLNSTCAWERQNAPRAFQKSKVGVQHDASSNHEGLYMYRYGRRCGRFNTLFVTTRRRACSIQRSDSSSGRYDIASRSTRPQASRVEGGERWKLERSLPGVRFSTARASVPFRFRALAARISPVAVRRKCRRGASPETPPDFYGDATRIGVASRVGSSIVNDQWRWGRTIGVHSASVPATAPRSASARSLAATSSFA